MSLAKAILIGYVGRDPELRYTPDGTQVCDFSVAVNDKFSKEEKTTWFRVTIWGKRAEAASRYLKKGSQVYIEGRLIVNEYVDKNGVTKISIDINASEVQFLDRKPDMPDTTAKTTTSPDDEAPF